MSLEKRKDFSGLVIQVNVSSKYNIANYFHQIPNDHIKKSQVSLKFVDFNLNINKTILIINFINYHKVFLNATC